MSKIIDKLKENPFFRVEKSYYKCPVCDGDLYVADSWLEMVMDGNAVFHCENDKEHKFWQNARESSDVLHLNKNASETDFHSEKDYKLVDGSWNVC